MRSSTSNSEVGGPWGRTWLLALVLTVLALALVEREWRALGFRPAVSDSARLWSAHRSRASGLERPGSVIVGSSRAQYAMDLQAWADETGWPEPIQLSLQGRSPLPVLRDLADDPTFAGLVIVEITERIFFQRTRRREARAQARVAESREIAVNRTASLESWIDQWIGRTFAFRNPDVAPDRMLARLEDGFPIKPGERWVEADRSAKMDFTRTTAANWQRRWLHAVEGERAPRPAVRNRVIRQTRAAVDAIRARGGEVVFVKFPSGGALDALESEKFPREQFWDVLVEGVGAPAIHFRDSESLSGFPTPDGSHLDVRDTDAFTRALARAIRERTTEN